MPKVSESKDYFENPLIVQSTFSIVQGKRWNPNIFANKEHGCCGTHWKGDSTGILETDFFKLFNVITYLYSTPSNPCLRILLEIKLIVLVLQI